MRDPPRRWPATRGGRTRRGRPADFPILTGGTSSMATTIEKRQPDAADQRDRIESYLQRSGLAARTPRVVPLTGDASDRRYFRILLPDAASIVLALYAEPFKFDALSFVNVARLLE